MNKKYDFCGFATKYNIKCGDGRTIKPNAFKDLDGKTVSLVWQHMHDSPKNVVGNAYLEHRDGIGLYAYGSLNNTELGEVSKKLIKHGDIVSMSIFANHLVQDGKDVLHGDVKEVSLCIAGANPEAKIENISIAHCDDGCVSYSETDEAIIHSGDMFETVLDHADTADDTDEKIENKDENKVADKTVQEVIDTMNEEQKTVLYGLVGQFINESVSDESEEGEKNMKHNVFDGETFDNDQDRVLTHADIDMSVILDHAKRGGGSLKEAVEDYLAHSITDSKGNTVTYGIADIDYLFPDYKNVNNTPDFVKREDSWVSIVMNGVKHTPFSRIKSIFADITVEEARAKGYIKGNQKVEEVFGLMKRTTDPQTVYKKQKLDRDDIIDITDFDVVAWLKGEMRMMLEEEIARAILIGDGRSSVSQDKIKEEHIRSILNDADFYSIKAPIVFGENDTDDDKAKKIIRAAVKTRKKYKGSGNPTFFTTEDVLTDMLLAEDTIGHRLYKDVSELATALRVKNIVTVEPMEGQTRTDEDEVVWDTIGIIVNLNDYNTGADKGGQTSLFDDFDIDCNQYKYLIETRFSGALVKHHAAIVLESVHETTDDEE